MWHLGVFAYVINAPLPASQLSRGAVRSCAVHGRADETAPSVAIITGGSGGIGLATAHRLASNGHDLVLGYGSNDDAAQDARVELETAHAVRVRTVKGDLTQEESREATITAIFSAVDNELGSL